MEVELRRRKCNTFIKSADPLAVGVLDRTECAVQSTKHPQAARRPVSWSSLDVPKGQETPPAQPPRRPVSWSSLDVRQGQETPPAQPPSQPISWGSLDITACCHGRVHPPCFSDKIFPKCPIRKSIKINAPCLPRLVQNPLSCLGLCVCKV